MRKAASVMGPDEPGGRHTTTGGAQPGRMFLHASARAAPASWARAAADSPESLAAAAARGPGVPNPGHGLRLHPHLAAGLRRCGYTTAPEDFSSCRAPRGAPPSSNRF